MQSLRELGSTEARKGHKMNIYSRKAVGIEVPTAFYATFTTFGKILR